MKVFISIFVVLIVINQMSPNGADDPGTPDYNNDFETTTPKLDQNYPKVERDSDKCSFENDNRQNGKWRGGKCIRYYECHQQGGHIECEKLFRKGKAKECPQENMNSNKYCQKFNNNKKVFCCKWTYEGEPPEP